MKSNGLIAKNIIIALVVCLFTMSLAGCSPSTARDAPFQIVFASLYMNETAISDYAVTLSNDLPDLTINGNAPMLTPVIAGEIKNDPEAGIIRDPMMGIAGMMKTSMLVAAGELDVVVASLDNAARDARGEMFLPLDEVFTADELASLGDRLLSFDHIDTDGYETWLTGAKTPVCGIDITGNEEMRAIFGNQKIGVFIVANTRNLELAKEVMLSLM